MNIKYAIATAAMIATLAACGGTTSTGSTAAKPITVPSTPAAAVQSTAAPSISTVAAVPATVAVANAVPAARATTKVNANTATMAELQAAFDAAGIPNAARWAREVDEYRPYATNDPTFAKLQKELAKYNPGQATVDKIIATLGF